MEKSKELNNLISLSRDTGQEIAFVQGGGGNTSVKLSKTKMAIKSSGTCLKDMSISSGYSIVNYSELSDFIRKLSKNEKDFSIKINSYSDENYPRPSIETGFHSILGKYVIHTHSVFVNTLTCAREGQSIIKKLFPKFKWVNYATPGLDLMVEILYQAPSSSSKPGAIFLQNHGLIVWADKVEIAYKIHEQISSSIIKEFDLDSFKFDPRKKYFPNQDKKEILFPDQAVYTMAGDEILSSRGAQETLCSYNYILNSINKIGLSPLYLDESEAHKLLSMESERYRQGLIKR